jgi:L-asparaginase
VGRLRATPTSSLSLALGLGFGLLALASAAPALGGQELPRVRVIATGGTIAGQAGADQLTGAELIDAVPEIAGVARIEVEEFSRIGSSAMTPDHWVRLSRRIDELFETDPDLAGVVITHGTDTMEETAYFLHLTVAHDRPVVVVGSMRVSSAVSADGPANLLAGVRVAAAPDARGLGVLVALNDEIHSARDVRKTDNNRVDTFASSEWGALGVVDADGVWFRRRITTRHTVDSELRIGSDDTLPHVAIVADYAGNDGAVLGSLGTSGVKGVVVQAFGGGRASPGMRRAASEIAALGVPVVLASRVPEGRVMGSSEAVARGILAAGDLPPHKARVLLMLALRMTSDPSRIQALLDTH